MGRAEDEDAETAGSEHGEAARLCFLKLNLAAERSHTEEKDIPSSSKHDSHLFPCIHFDRWPLPPASLCHNRRHKVMKTGSTQATAAKIHKEKKFGEACVGLSELWVYYETKRVKPRSRLKSPPFPSSLHAPRWSVLL